MVNLDVIIKKIRNLYPGSYNWPELSYRLEVRLKECLRGFPGIGFSDISLIEFKNLLPDDLWILDTELLTRSRILDNAPIMFSSVDKKNNIYRVEGIGCQEDSRDPLRKSIRWMDLHSPEVSPDDLVIRVDCRPTENGGPGYYYFFKAYRDQRP